MKETLKINWIINFSIWAIIYLVRTFAIWEFNNPFQWIIDIPTYETWNRGGMLVLLLCWQAAQMFSIYSHLKDSNKI